MPPEPSTLPRNAADDREAVPTAPPEPFVYADGLDHLADELVYMRALIRRYLQRHGSLRPGGEGTNLSGFAVTTEEIERFLVGAAAPMDADEEDFIGALRTSIDERVQASRAAGVRLPLPELVESFGLSALESNVLLVLLAPELEPAFERAYSFAWNDFTRKTADVGFVLSMVLGTFRERCESSLIFSPTEPLRWNGLVEVEQSAEPTQRGFLARPIRLATRVVGYLLGDPTPDELIQAYVSVLEPRPTREDIVLAPEALDKVWRALAMAADGAGSRVCLRGPPGCGKKLLMRAVLHDRAQSVLTVDMMGLWADPAMLELRLRAARREALLQGAALYLDCTEFEVVGDIGRQLRLTVERVLRDFPSLLVFGAGMLVPFYGGVRGGLLDIFIPLPEAEQREILWRQAVPRHVKLAPGAALEELARQYPLSGGAILGAVRGAVARARQRDLQRPVVRRVDFVDCARQQLTGRLATLATRLTTSLSWNDLVLPTEAMDRLRELTAFARHRKKVFEEWGFGALLPYGRGLSALFHGPPGTGKTMVAGIIAGELGMDLFRVDLSQITSKYVGETEKNLARIFDEAGQSHSVLLFDEADSLFAKRTEVKSATDRYANLEVNYLLQRMEDFDGVTVLTTNFESGIDDAFKRRIRFRIEFPFPDQSDREVLWQRMIPAAAEIESGIRYDDLAYDFELSGGHIKNAIVRAAFVAAERADVIRYEDLRAAGSLECKEIGKLVREFADDEMEQSQ